MSQGGRMPSLGETCSWRGASGRSYRFSVYEIDAPTLSLDGVFVLAAPGDLFTAYRPLFIGQADDFAAELPALPELEEAMRAGADSLHLYYTNLTNPDRYLLLRDLLARHRPPLNRSMPAPVRRDLPAGTSALVIPFTGAVRRSA